MNSETSGNLGFNSGLLTAVIPAKNLLKNLNSFLKVLAQPYSEKVSIVLVIDEPEDEAERLKKILEKDSQFRRVKVVYGEYNSPGIARNVGLGEVKTKWVTFWDSDDEPKIEEVVKTVEIANELNSEIAIARFEVELISSGDRQLSSTFKDKKKINLREISLNPAIWRMSFLTDIAQQCSFPDLRMGEDQVYLSRLRMNDRKIHFSNTVSYVYKQGHSEQLTANKSNIKDLISAFEINVESFAQTLAGSKSRFDMQLLVREFITLIKNRVLYEPSQILLKNFSKRILFKFSYEFLALILILIGKRKHKW